MGTTSPNLSQMAHGNPLSTENINQNPLTPIRVSQLLEIRRQLRWIRPNMKRHIASLAISRNCLKKEEF